MNTDFFVVDTIIALDHKLFAGGQYTNDQSVRCPNCGRFVRSESNSFVDIQLNYIGKFGFTEYLWNSHTLPLFRKDLVELWQESNLSGFKIKPVQITGWYKKPKKLLPSEIPEYFELIPINYVKLISPEPLQPPCPLCGFVPYAFPKIGNQLLNSIQIDKKSWEGSDFFSVNGYNFLFCTRNVVEVTLMAGYSKAIAFVNVLDWWRWEDFDIHKWSPKSYQAYLEKFLIRKVEDLHR